MLCILISFISTANNNKNEQRFFLLICNVGVIETVDRNWGAKGG